MLVMSEVKQNKIILLYKNLKAGGWGDGENVWRGVGGVGFQLLNEKVMGMNGIAQGIKAVILCVYQTLIHTQ